MPKVDVDMTACIHSGMCATIAPTVFKINDDAQLEVLTAEVDGDDLAQASDAVACCPMEAISLRD